MISSVKSRPKFRIREGGDDSEHDAKFDDFKKDWLDPSTRATEVRQKYDLPVRVYTEFINRIRAETGLKSKPFQNRMKSDMSYIYRLKDRWGIQKTFGSKAEVKYYGYYADLEVAQFVRDKLYESNWDDEVAEELMNRYSVGKIDRRKSTRVYEKYDDFKELYLNHPIKMEDICRKLRISSASYTKLRNKLKEEIPDAKKHPIPRSGRGNMRYIYRDGCGYQVSKTIDGKTVCFGYYKRLQDAVEKRDKLERNDWHE